MVSKVSELLARSREVAGSASRSRALLGARGRLAAALLVTGVAMFSGPALAAKPDKVATPTMTAEDVLHMKIVWERPSGWPNRYQLRMWRTDDGVGTAWTWPHVGGAWTEVPEHRLAVCRTLGHRLNMDLSPVVLASG